MDGTPRCVAFTMVSRVKSAVILNQMQLACVDYVRYVVK